MAELSLRGHLIDELRDLLDAEQQLTRALPQFAQAAASPMLRTAFEKHLQETKRHLNRLTQAIESIGETARAKRCEGMRGLISEGNSLVAGTPKGALRDAMMIAAAQKTEHYEMAAYGTARTYAAVLGRADIARMLDDTLQEEKAADLKLTEIAESNVNDNAAAEWHQQSSGVVEQGAEWIGQTVGAATRQMRRAAGAVGIRPETARGAMNSMGRMMENTAETMTDAAESATQAAMAQARQLTRQTAQAARSVAGDRSAAARTRTTTRTQGGGRKRTAGGDGSTTAKRRRAGKKR